MQTSVRTNISLATAKNEIANQIEPCFHVDVEKYTFMKKNTIYVHRVCILNNSTKMSNKEIPGKMSSDVTVGYLPIF